MAIQKINLGAPVTGVGGDKYRAAHTKINDNFIEVNSRLSGLQSGSTSQGAEISALKAKDVSQDNAITALQTKDTEQDDAIALRALKTEVDSKNTLQDDAIALRALKTEVDSKNTLQDTAITALQDKDVAQDADISLRALKTDVDSKNTLQDDAINLRAIKSEVNAKNDLQDTAITAAQNKADAAIPKTDKGAVNGVATLGADGKVTSMQLPDVTPVAWGNITGDIADQLDLSELYYTKTEVDSTTQFLFDGLSFATLNGNYYDTTTTAYPNVNIAEDGKLSRSTATFGTAATKDVGTGAEQIPQNKNLGTAATRNVGTAAGDVMEVGAFGLGRATVTHSDSTYNPIARFKGFNATANAIPAQAGQGISFGYPEYVCELIVTSEANYRLLFRAGDNQLAAWKEAATKDASGNLPVASIQAGIGAPKIAYKKLTGVSASAKGNTVMLPHGLNHANILSVELTYSNTNGVFYPGDSSSIYVSFIDADVLGVALSAGASTLVNKDFKILITYEV